MCSVTHYVRVCLSRLTWLHHKVVKGKRRAQVLTACSAEVVEGKKNKGVLVCGVVGPKIVFC